MAIRSRSGLVRWICIVIFNRFALYSGLYLVVKFNTEIMIIRKFNGTEVSKKQYEVIQFIQTGSNHFWDAYYVFEQRKKRDYRPSLTIMSWFNKTIRGLHDIGLCKEIPFAYVCEGGFLWANPGINASKANFECITIQDQFQESQMEFNRIL